MPQTTGRPALRALYDTRSKHSAYQLIHPTLLPHLGEAAGLPVGKQEAQRQRWFERAVPMAGKSVLDIGANTGYFSFAALQSGARKVRSQEGNAAHAEFIATAADALGAAGRLQVVPTYFEFAPEADERFDVALCLNVVHHLGDDFGDGALSIDQARAGMLAAIDAMAAWTETLVLQIGFNWKGDRRLPLFAGGEKASVIDFVRAGTAGRWRLDEIVVADARTGEYVPVDAGNLARDDALGEFMNRPLFKLTALDAIRRFA
ncbi:MAG: class I SAM-dependent methyltransferase [Burkholderiaceae bacterium]